jgi:hypothetical protein
MIIVYNMLEDLDFQGLWLSPWYVLAWKVDIFKLMDWWCWGQICINLQLFMLNSYACRLLKNVQLNLTRVKKHIPEVDIIMINELQLSEVLPFIPCFTKWRTRWVILTFIYKVAFCEAILIIEHLRNCKLWSMVNRLKHGLPLTSPCAAHLNNCRLILCVL